MIDLKEIKTDLENNIEKLKSKGCEVDIKEVISLQEKKNSTQTSVDELKQEKNNLSKRIGQESANGSDVNKLKAEAESINKKIDAEVDRFNSLQLKFSELVAQIPNLPDDDVPRGDSEDHNIVLDEVIYRKEEGLDHVEIGNKLGLLDFDLANKISGSRYVVLKGKLAQLQRALIQFMLDHAEANGYSEYYVPLIVNSESLFGTGQLPKFEEDQFSVGQDKYLIPTAEVPLTNFIRDKVLDGDELPLKLCAHTPCFRSEAGSYGKDTKGMIRQHQFEKVEIVQIVHPENSEKVLDELVTNAKSLLDHLELSYRTVNLCSGDLGFSAAKTIDIEVWLPSQNRYREISSCSNFKCFQARRLNSRAKDKSGKFIPHTLNGSALAVGRCLVAIIENYFDKNKGILVPKALKKYLKFDCIELQ
ncbi:MAG: serine--tRNA ligase [Pseudomonadota bacterium]|nr:serine--tRNA ligase [Pseudomonadota bacterium]